MEASAPGVSTCDGGSTLVGHWGGDSCADQQQGASDGGSDLHFGSERAEGRKEENDAISNTGNERLAGIEIDFEQLREYETRLDILIPCSFPWKSVLFLMGIDNVSFEAREPSRNGRQKMGCGRDAHHIRLDDPKNRTMNIVKRPGSGLRTRLLDTTLCSQKARVLSLAEVGVPSTVHGRA